MERRSEIAERRVVIAVGLSSLAMLILATAMPVFGWSFSHAVLGTACHQDPERCLPIAGLPMSLCARCSAIFSGLFLGSGLIFVSAPSRRLALRLLLFAASATALDVLAESAGLFNNLVSLRLVTGWVLGFAIILMIGSQGTLGALIKPSPTSVHT